MPGFGRTHVPPERNYHYSFAALAFTAQAFMESLGLRDYALYVFDYSAPVDYRLAVTHPECVTAIVPRSACDILTTGEAWDLIRRFWLEPTADNRNAVLPLLSLDGRCWEQDGAVEEAECAGCEGSWSGGGCF